MGFWSIVAICWTVMAVAFQVRLMVASWCEARAKMLPGIGDRLTRLEAFEEADGMWSHLVDGQLYDLQKRVNVLERRLPTPAPEHTP